MHSRITAGVNEAYQEGAILFYTLSATQGRGATLSDNKGEGARYDRLSYNYRSFLAAPPVRSDSQNELKKPQKHSSRRAEQQLPPKPAAASFTADSCQLKTAVSCIEREMLSNQKSWQLSASKLAAVCFSGSSLFKLFSWQFAGSW